MNAFEIYTDGACDNMRPPNYGSWAFVVLEDGEIIHDGKGSETNTTNNRMELFAIISSLIEIPNDSDIRIYTDSQYCIKVLSNMTKIFPANMDLIEQYRQIVGEMNLTINFSWVKGHNGNKYNEIVDKMAGDEFRRISGYDLQLNSFHKNEKSNPNNEIESLRKERDYWKMRYENLANNMRYLLQNT